MENYIEKASDVNITGKLLYVKAIADGFVYTDAECTVKADAELLNHLFEMDHAVIVDGISKFRPISISDYADERYVGLTYIKAVTAGEPEVAGLEGELVPFLIPTVVVVYSSEYGVTEEPVEEPAEASTEADIKSFAIATGSTAVINDEAKTIAVEMPNGSVVNALAPTFTISDNASIKVGETDQVSGVTTNDFTLPVTYSVTAQDATTVVDWVVTVTEAAAEASTEADIKSFAIATGSTAVINDEAKTIAVEMPNGSDVTELAPTFTISDNASIKVGETDQVSGVTTNDFTLPVTYSVTAQDATTVVDWVVTVTEAAAEASTEADIKSFAIATGSTAVINDEAKTIAVEMPNGSDVTELTPTFTISDNASIKVGETDQVSGVTTNDFTLPVTYSVTAEDATTVVDWVVTVTEAIE